MSDQIERRARTQDERVGQRDEQALAVDALRRESQAPGATNPFNALKELEDNFSKIDKDDSGALSFTELSWASQYSANARWAQKNIDVLSKVADTDVITLSSGIRSQGWKPTPPAEIKEPGKHDLMPIFMDNHKAQEGISRNDIRTGKMLFNR